MSTMTISVPIIKYNESKDLFNQGEPAIVHTDTDVKLTYETEIFSKICDELNFPYVTLLEVRVETSEYNIDIITAVNGKVELNKETYKHSNIYLMSIELINFFSNRLIDREFQLKKLLEIYICMVESFTKLWIHTCRLYCSTATDFQIIPLIKLIYGYDDAKLEHFIEIMKHVTKPILQLQLCNKSNQISVIEFLELMIERNNLKIVKHFINVLEEANIYVDLRSPIHSAIYWQNPDILSFLMSSHNTSAKTPTSIYITSGPTNKIPPYKVTVDMLRDIHTVLSDHGLDFFDSLYIVGDFIRGLICRSIEQQYKSQYAYLITAFPGFVTTFDINKEISDRDIKDGFYLEMFEELKAVHEMLIDEL